MNTQAHYDPAVAGELSQQIAKLLVDHEPDTRRRAVIAALALVGDSPVEVTAPAKQEVESVHEAPDLAGFITEVEAKLQTGQTLKPSDYALLSAAYYFSTYGMVEFTVKELMQLGRDAGLVLPARLDMTLNKATKKGKKMFQPVGRGRFKPTAMAGIEFKERWGLKPGKKPKSSDKKGHSSVTD